jgi:CcmD family protein
MRKIPLMLLVAYGVLFSAVCFAQSTITGNERPEMAVAMRSNGKIYVVVAVVVAILLGVVFYLITLDRKISRLEREGGVRRDEL